MKTVLSFTIVFALLAGLPAFGAASTEASSFEAQMNETREEFFGSCSEEVLNLEKIEIDNSRIIHLPQEYTEPEPPSLFAPFSAVQASAASAGPFDIGDRRDFRARTGAHGSVNEWRVVSADLAGQGEHTNIWVVDCSFMHGTICVIATCHQKDITPALANEIANQVDVIYRRMTGEGGFGAHAGVRIEAGFSNMPAIGDLSGDGKVNYLLYDIMGSGGSGGSFTAGFFTNEDFFTHGPDGSFRNTIDMLHIDIGNNQGFNAFRAGASDEDRFSVYNTLAHELQHLLFYMHFGIYAPSGTSRDYAWLNEALSELAGTYYVQKDAEIVSFSRLRRAAQNSYSNTSGYGD
ncbi:MAG: hypothetical protein LBC86_00720, partial [Oscillospiraceae bacterium]|nr:hypothetical protein [Oscillospiraceae bacterium]